MVGKSEHGNEPSVLVKCDEFLYQVRSYWLLKKDCTPWSS